MLRFDWGDNAFGPCLREFSRGEWTTRPFEPGSTSQGRFEETIICGPPAGDTPDRHGVHAPLRQPYGVELLAKRNRTDAETCLRSDDLTEAWEHGGMQGLPSRNTGPPYGTPVPPARPKAFRCGSYDPLASTKWQLLAATVHSAAPLPCFDRPEAWPSATRLGVDRRRSRTIGPVHREHSEDVGRDRGSDSGPVVRTAPLRTDLSLNDQGPSGSPYCRLWRYGTLASDARGSTGPDDLRTDCCAETGLGTPEALGACASPVDDTARG